MTIVVTLTNGETLVSVSDGMISRSTPQRTDNVLSQVQKFICFRPCIKVASVNMGRIDAIVRSHLQEIYLAYAGNYSTISAIASEFGSIINSQLFAWPDHNVGRKVITRDPTLEPYRVGDRAFDDLKGFRMPLARFGVTEAAIYISDLIQKHAGDFAFQQGDNPDVEIQLVSKGDNSMECVELLCKGLAATGFASGASRPSVTVNSRSVQPYELSVLGNVSVRKEILDRFSSRLAEMAKTAQYLQQEVDEFTDPKNEYAALSSSYAELVSELTDFTLSIIARNRNGVGGEAKVLSYHPAGGYTIRYVAATE